MVSSRPPLVNPFDAFGEKQFSSWIGDVTSRIQSALNPPEPPYTLPQLPVAFRNINQSSNSQEPEESDEEEFIPHITVDKGKGRAPDEGPGIDALKRISSQPDITYPQHQYTPEKDGGSPDAWSVSGHSDEDTHEAYHDAYDVPQEHVEESGYYDRPTPESLDDDEDEQDSQLLGSRNVDQDELVITDIEDDVAETEDEEDKDMLEYEDQQMPNSDDFAAQQEEIYDVDADADDEDEVEQNPVEVHDTADAGQLPRHSDDNDEEGDGEEDYDHNDEEDSILGDETEELGLPQERSSPSHEMMPINNYTGSSQAPLYQTDSSGAIVLSSDSEDGGDGRVDGGEGMVEDPVVHSYDYDDDAGVGEGELAYPEDGHAEEDDELEDFDGDVVEEHDERGDDPNVETVDANQLITSGVSYDTIQPVEMPSEAIPAYNFAETGITDQFGSTTQGFTLEHHLMPPPGYSYSATYASNPAVESDSVPRFSDVVASALNVLDMVNQQVQPLSFPTAGATDIFEPSAFSDLAMFSNQSGYPASHTGQLDAFQPLPTLDPHLSFFAEPIHSLPTETSSTSHDIIDVDTFEDHDEAAAAPIIDIPNLTHPDELSLPQNPVYDETQGISATDPDSGIGYESDNDDVEGNGLPGDAAHAMEVDPQLDTMVEELPEEDEVIHQRVRSAGLDHSFIAQNPDPEASAEDHGNSLEAVVSVHDPRQSTGPEVDEGYAAEPESDGREMGEIELPVHVAEVETVAEENDPTELVQPQDSITEGNTEDAIQEQGGDQDLRESYPSTPREASEVREDSQVAEDDVEESEVPPNGQSVDNDVVAVPSQDNGSSSDSPSPTRADHPSEAHGSGDDIGDDPFKHMGTDANGIGGEVEIDELSSGVNSSNDSSRQPDEAEYDDEIDAVDEAGMADLEASQRLPSIEVDEYEDDVEVEVEDQSGVADVEEEELERDASMLSEDGIDEPEAEADEYLTGSDKENKAVEVFNNDGEPADDSHAAESMDVDDESMDDSVINAQEAQPVDMMDPEASSPATNGSELYQPLPVAEADSAANSDEDDDASFISSMLSPTDLPTPSVVIPPPTHNIYRHVHKGAADRLNQVNATRSSPPTSTEPNGREIHSRNSSNGATSSQIHATSNPNTPVTRSNCRFHKISIPVSEEETEDSKDDSSSAVKSKSRVMHFIVPGCALSARDIMKNEGIEDCGEATRQENESKIFDLACVDVYVVGTLRKLVGLDLLNEGQCAYLPSKEELAALKAKSHRGSFGTPGELLFSKSLPGPSRPKKRKYKQNFSIVIDYPPKSKEVNRRTSIQASSPQLSSPALSEENYSEPEVASSSKALRPPASQASTSSLSATSRHRARKSRGKGIANADKAYQPSGETESDGDSGHDARAQRRKKRAKRSTITADKLNSSIGGELDKDNAGEYSPQKQDQSGAREDDRRTSKTGPRSKLSNSMSASPQKGRLKRKSTKDAGSLKYRPGKNGESSEDDDSELAEKRRKKRRPNGSVRANNRADQNSHLGSSPSSPTSSTVSLPHKMEVEVVIPLHHSRVHEEVSDRNGVVESEASSGQEN